MSDQFWVYRLFNADDELIYAGMTELGQERIDQHLRGRWRKEIADVTVEIWPSREEAADREREIIRTEQPRYNVQRYERKVAITFVDRPKSVAAASSPVADAVTFITSPPIDTEAARRLGQIPKRRKFTHECPVCGVTFLATARGIYCSPKCNWIANNARRTPRQPAPTEATS